MTSFINKLLSRQNLSEQNVKPRIKSRFEGNLMLNTNDNIEGIESVKDNKEIEKKDEDSSVEKNSNPNYVKPINTKTTPLPSNFVYSPDVKKRKLELNKQNKDVIKPQRNTTKQESPTREDKRESYPKQTQIEATTRIINKSNLVQNNYSTFPTNIDAAKEPVGKMETPTIKVSIGSINIQTTKQKITKPVVKKKEFKPKLSLEDYLKNKG